jgi:hypothetical protein
VSAAYQQLLDRVRREHPGWSERDVNAEAAKLAVDELRHHGRGDSA